MARIDNLTNFLTDVATAIRTKKETETEIPAENFDTEILSIETGIDTSDATAMSGDILSPKTAYVNGQKITGTIGTTYDIIISTILQNTYDIEHTINNYIWDINLDLGIALVGTFGSKTLEIYRVKNYKLTDLIIKHVNDYNIYGAVIGKTLNSYGKIVVAISSSVNSSSNVNTYLTVYQILPDDNTYIESSAYCVGYTRSMPMPVSINPQYPDIIILPATRSMTGSSYNSFKIMLLETSINGLNTISTTNASQSNWGGSVTYGKIEWNKSGTYFDVKMFNDSGIQVSVQRYSYNPDIKQIRYIEHPIEAYTRCQGEDFYFKNNQVYSQSNNLLATLDFTVSNTDKMWYNENYLFIRKSDGLYVYYYDKTTKTCEQKLYISSTQTTTLERYIGTMYPPSNSNLQCSLFQNNLITSLSVFEVDNVPYYKTIDVYGNTFYNTSDADVTPQDIVKDKIGYGPDGKIIGDVEEIVFMGEGNVSTIAYGDDGSSFTESWNPDKTVVYGKNTAGDVLVRPEAIIGVQISNNVLANNIGLTDDKIKTGETILGITGTYEGSGTGGSLRGTISYETSQQLLEDTSQEINTVGIVQTIDENNEISEVLVYKWNGTEWQTLGLDGGVLSNNEYDTAIFTCNQILGKNENLDIEEV